jgi:hypothetical protein
MTGILLLGRPYAGPARAAIGADADQVEGLRPFLVLGCQVMLELVAIGGLVLGEVAKWGLRRA